jgi:PKD repeat protein
VEASVSAVEPRFEHDPATPVTGQLVRFDASASSIPDGRSATYLWDFDGDGRVDAESPVPRVGHTFEEFGRFGTTLTVVLETGERASDWTWVEVRVPPEAAFSSEPRQPVAGASARFDASNSTDPDGEVVAYEWDFDDDGRVDARGPVVTHTFDTAGRGTVSLVVVDDDGLRDRAETRVVRAPAPDPFPDRPLLIAAGVASVAAGGFAVVTGSLGTLARQISDDGTERNDDDRSGSVVRVDRLSVLDSPDESLLREFVDLRNESDEWYDLGGTSLADDEGHVYEVPDGVTLAPDETIRIATGTGPRVRGTLYWGREESVWDAAGGRVVVRDAGGDVLDDVHYGDWDGV